MGEFESDPGFPGKGSASGHPQICQCAWNKRIDQIHRACRWWQVWV